MELQCTISNLDVPDSGVIRHPGPGRCPGLLSAPQEAPARLHEGAAEEVHTTHTLDQDPPLGCVVHPEQLPVLQAPLMVSALHRYTIFYLFYYSFTVPFLCLHMFSYTNTCHCVTIVYSI